MDDVVATYSVSFRLQRLMTEFAFVSVPVTADLMVEQADCTDRIDVDKIVLRALEIGRAADVAWHSEAQEIKLHPIQTPPPGLAESKPVA